MKNKSLLIVLILLLGLAYWLITRDTGLSKEELTVNTEQLSKIFLADMQDNTVTLNKRDGQWYVNNQWPARADMMGNLLNTLKRIKADQPVPQAAQANVLNMLSTVGVKTELYTTSNTPYYTFTIGGATDDAKGNYILKQGSTQPFIFKMLGYDGDFSSMFATKTDNWKSLNILPAKPARYSSFGIVYHYTADSNWQVNANNGFMQVSNAGSNYPIINTQKPKQYFDMLTNIKCYGYDNGFAFKDSIIKTEIKYATINYTLTDNTNKSITFYYLKANQRTKGPIKINGIAYDPEFLYGYDGIDFFTVSTAHMAKVFTSIKWWQQ
jgi:hypothetical protein